MKCRPININRINYSRFIEWWRKWNSFKNCNFQNILIFMSSNFGKVIILMDNTLIPLLKWKFRCKFYLLKRAIKMYIWITYCYTHASLFGSIAELRTLAFLSQNGYHRYVSIHSLPICMFMYRTFPIKCPWDVTFFRKHIFQYFEIINLTIFECIGYN